MVKTNCPSCGAEISFRSTSTVLCVCSFCRSNIVRHDIDFEVLGKQSDLLDDMSPLQLGVSGRYNNKSFIILGRQILSWTDGRWNEWYIVFNDGTDGWIAEAQGEFSILLKPIEKVSLPVAPKFYELKIGNIHYRLVDTKRVKCLGSEGELPFKTIEGSRSVVYDYADNNNHFASLEIEATSEKHLYAGDFVSLAALKISGIRRFAGWGKP